MGIYAARSAVLVATNLQLGHPAARLLFHMATICLDARDLDDGKEPCRFWQGRVSQALALGYKPDQAETTAARSAVKRAIRELSEKRAIELVSTGYFGHRSEYFLRLNSTTASPDLTQSLRDPQPAPAPATATYPQGTAERPPLRVIPMARTRSERLQAGRHMAPGG